MFEKLINLDGGGRPLPMPCQPLKVLGVRPRNGTMAQDTAVEEDDWRVTVQRHTLQSLVSVACMSHVCHWLMDAQFVVYLLARVQDQVIHGGFD